MHNTSLSGAASFAFSFIFDLVFLWLLSFLFFIYFWLSKCLVGSCIFIVDLFKLVLLFVSIYICVECEGDTCSTTGKLAAAAGNSSRNSFGRVIQHFISSFWAKGTKSSRGNSQKQSYAKTAESRTAPTLSLSLSHWSSLSYISTTTVGATAKVCVCVYKSLSRKRKWGPARIDAGNRTTRYCSYVLPPRHGLDDSSISFLHFWPCNHYFPLISCFLEMPYLMISSHSSSSGFSLLRFQHNKRRCC